MSYVIIGIILFASCLVAECKRQGTITKRRWEREDAEWTPITGEDQAVA